MIGLRFACATLAVLTGAGCWASMPVRESSGGAGPLPTVIAPEAEPALEPGPALEAEDDATPLSVDPVDDDAPEPAVEASAKLEVEAALVETASAPYCGILKVVVVMRYEVRRVISGTYTARELYVAHMCPEMAPPPCPKGAGARIDRFRPGEVHRLQLTRGAGDGSVVDKFKGRALPRYRSHCGELAGPSGSQ